MANLKQFELLRTGVQEWNQWREENPRSRVNLRGANLRALSLRGVDLSNADIRGTSFRDSDLSEANLIGVRAGLETKEIAFCFSIVLLAICGCTVFWTALWALVDNLNVTISIFSIFWGLMLTGSFLSLPHILPYALNITGLGLAERAGGVGGLLITSVIYFLCLFFGLSSVSHLPRVTFPAAFHLAFVPLAIVLLSPKYTLLKDIWKRSDRIFSSKVGTSFESANLTETNFYGATLRNSTFDKAITTRTKLYMARGVRWATFENTNLNNLAILNLVVTHAGQAASFPGENLKGLHLRRANLDAANLKGANLECSDLSGATLRRSNLSKVKLSGSALIGANLEGSLLRGADLGKADLSRANLSKTLLAEAQVLGTRFQGVTLTGACLKDWNTNQYTNLEDAQAEYIFLDIDEEGHPSERRPRHDEFKQGEFAILFQQAQDTLDLIFVDGIDWQSFFASFQEIRQKYAEAELSIQAIERKSSGSFVVRLETDKQTDKAALQQSWNEVYEDNQRLKALLLKTEGKLEGYKEQLGDFQEKVLRGMADQKQTIINNLEGSQINNFANQVSDNAQQVYNAASGQNLAEIAAEIQTLLEQLSEKYPSEKFEQKAKLGKLAASQAKTDIALHQQIISALDAGTIGAVGEMLSHPIATFFIEAVKDWEENRT